MYQITAADIGKNTLYGNIATSNLGTKTVSGFQEAVITLANSMVVDSFKNVSFVCNEASGVFVQSRYIGTISKPDSARIVVDLHIQGSPDIISGYYNGTTWMWDKVALNSKFTWRSEIPSTFDSTKVTEVVAMRRGYTVLVRVIFKAGLATDWHNDIVTGLSNVYTPPTSVYGVMRVNSAADINKRAIAIMYTNGNVQFLPGETFNTDVPFEFVFPTANNN